MNTRKHCIVKCCLGPTTGIEVARSIVRRLSVTRPAVAAN